MTLARRLYNAVLALLHVAAIIIITLFFRQVCFLLSGGDSNLYYFLVLFTWRYLRFGINLLAFWCYFPSRKPKQPTYTTTDVTAVIPTVDPARKAFHETLKSCADNNPAKIIVVTAGDQLYRRANKYVMRQFANNYPSIKFAVLRTQVASKRAQVALAVPEIETDIAVLLDDHVFWGPKYLETILYPFEDERIGLVGTNKRVRRKEGLDTWGRIWNMIGATYLCRHNFEIRATNTVDGGVFVVSGRTCAIRSEILRHPEFVPGLVNERFFFGLFGPLNADDDNYNTRFVVRQGWKIKIQYTEDAVMYTDLGVEKPLVSKFLGQCRRWARTTWRSNLCSLITDRSVYIYQPYSVYAVYLTSLTNFAAIVDPLLVYLLTHSALYTIPYTLPSLLGWIFFTKTVKVFDYFRRNPRDIPLFPAYLLFGYFHSLIKFWTLLTFWDITWSGRQLDQIKVNTTPSPPPSSANSSSRTHEEDDQDQQDAHPHLTTLRAIRARITALRATQTEHTQTYQLPLLTELRQLRTTFAALAQEHTAMAGNSAAIREELRLVARQAEEAQAVLLGIRRERGVAGAGRDEVERVLGGVRDAVRGVEVRLGGSGGRGAAVGAAAGAVGGGEATALLASLDSPVASSPVSPTSLALPASPVSPTSVALPASPASPTSIALPASPASPTSLSLPASPASPVTVIAPTAPAKEVRQREEEVLIVY